MEIFGSQGSNFKVRLLNQDDLQSAYQLLKDVADEMTLKGKKYIHAKSIEEMNAILSEESDDKMAGIFLLDEEGQEVSLVSEMGYFSVNEDEKRDNSKTSILPNFNAENVQNSEIAFVGSVCVSSNFRKRGFSNIMDSFLELRSPKKYSVSMVDVENFMSFGHFLDAGFFLTQKTVDPSDGGDIFYFIKDIHQKNPVVINKEIMPISVSNFSQFNLGALLKQEYLGCGFNKETMSVEFIRSRKIMEHFGCVKPIIQNSFASLPKSASAIKKGLIEAVNA